MTLPIGAHPGSCEIVASLNHPHIAQIIYSGKQTESDISIVERPKR